MIEVIIENGSVWRNKKHGNLYRVTFGSAEDATNSRPWMPEVVVYEPLPHDGRVYTRERPEFLEKFEEIK